MAGIEEVLSVSHSREPYGVDTIQQLAHEALLKELYTNRPEHGAGQFIKKLQFMNTELPITVAKNLPKIVDIAGAQLVYLQGHVEVFVCLCH